MMPSERRLMALRHIEKTGSCGIDELVKALNVSRVTVHRILDELESQGTVRKERGGVRIVPPENSNDAFSQRKLINYDLKREIAEKALDFVSNEDTIFMDASTTVFCLVEVIATKLSTANLTIVTNSPAVAWHLGDVSGFHIISLGGELDQNLTAFGGPIALEALSGLHFNKAFISPNAVSTQGISTPHSINAAILRKVMTLSSEQTLLAESPKFSRLAPIMIAPIKDLTRIITDSKLPDEVRAEYEDIGVEII